MADKKARIQIARPASRKEVYSRNSSGRSKQIVKVALQQYIDSYFNSSGINRNIMESIAPNGLQYTTDETFTDSRNPIKRKLFLARMYEQTKMQLPSIIISDTSYDPQIGLRGLGALDDAKIENVCLCSHCSGTNFKQIRDLPNTDKFSFLRKHNWWVLEKAFRDLYEHSSDIIHLEKFLKTRSKQQAKVKELITAIALVDIMKDFDICLIQELLDPAQKKRKPTHTSRRQTVPV